MRRYVPPQHGAWAMLLVPFTAGVLLGGPAWVHLPLLVAWVGGYLLSYYALLAVKTRRVARVRAQLRLYAAVTVPAAAVPVLVQPRLLWFGLPLAGLVAVNAWYAWRRDERSAVNDLAGVVQGVLMVPVAVVAAGGSAWDVAPASAVLLLYFAGTVPYVKTMIRERGSRSWLLGSVGYHGVATCLAGAVAVPFAAPFAWLMVRAAVLPGRGWTPKRVGVLEIVHSLLLLVLVVALLRP
ncbi:YwiC-like family protein [Thalassiella azotivora]